MTDRGPGAAAPQRHPDPILACVCACTLLVVGLVAAINLAVPMIAASRLHPGASALLWIVDAYVVVFAGLVIPGGAAGDRFGRKGMLITGLLVFAAGAAVCAASGTVPIMLVGRPLNGVGAALVLPNCVGVLVHGTPPARRARALAIWGVTSGLGGIVGNLGGGLLLTTGSWRTLFAPIAFIAVLCALWVALAAPRSSRHSRSLDPAGSLLFVLTTIALLVGIIEGPERGWTDGVVIGAFVLSGLLGTGWVLTEFRSSSPLLDPRLFRVPALSGAGLGMMVTFFGSFGLFFLNASLLQYSRGYSVLRAGLATLPLAVPLLIGSRLVPRLVKRLGIPVTLTIAFVLISAGLSGLSTAAVRSYPAYAAWLVVVGIGFACALPTLTTELTAALPAEQAGVAGGLQAATRELGSALGVAVVGTVLTSTFISHLPAFLPTDPPPRTVAAALAAAPAARVDVVDAFVSGAQRGLQVAAAVTFLAGLLVIAALTTTRRKRQATVSATTGPSAPLKETRR